MTPDYFGRAALSLFLVFSCSGDCQELRERQWVAGLIYCRGGIGALDDGGAIGVRDDCSPCGGLRAGAAMGRGGGGAGIFASISTSAFCSLSISRDIWS